MFLSRQPPWPLSFFKKKKSQIDDKRWNELVASVQLMKSSKKDIEARHGDVQRRDASTKNLVSESLKKKDF